MRRIESEEILDGADVPRHDLERSLRDLRNFNRFCGGISLYRRLVAWFGPRSILDIGTGTSDLLESVPDVRLRIGLDFKLEHLLYLRGNSRVLRVAGDAKELPFRDGAVDLVTSSHFFHHFSPDENAAILDESLRVSRRGVAATDTRRHIAPLLFVQLLGMLRVIGRVTRLDGPASLRQGYTVPEARSIARRVGAARRDVIRAWPFRLAILLWK